MDAVAWGHCVDRVSMVHNARARALSLRARSVLHQMKCDATQLSMHFRVARSVRLLARRVDRPTSGPGSFAFWRFRAEERLRWRKRNRSTILRSPPAMRLSGGVSHLLIPLPPIPCDFPPQRPLSVST